MSPTTLIFDFLTTSVFSGLLATAAMTLFVYGANRAGLCSLGLVETVGSTVTGALNRAALPVGALLHITAGVAFAMLYTMFFFMTPLREISTSLIPAISAMLGAAHGFVVFFILVPLLAENHPIRNVREEGTTIALVYFFAHILFGLTLGFCLTFSPLF